VVAKQREETESTFFKKVLSVLYFLLVLYLFFLCIELMGTAFKMFGNEEAKALLSVTEDPIVGLLIGILATSLMQSSSSTTSIVVGMVAAGTVTIENAIPIVMGANIGTTITNSIISLGHVQRRAEFERAFSGAVVHDFFNLCTVALFLPIEVFFHPIRDTAMWLSNSLVGFQGAEFKSPLKAIVKPAVDLLESLGTQMTSNHKILAGVFLSLALFLLIFTLSRMVKIMRGAMASKLEVVVDRYLFTGVVRGFVIGMIITAIVQSSSVTTSAVIPLLGAGIVRLEAVFPYMVGANIGTTFTAVLASLVTGNPAALTVAICHFVFNIFGTAVFLPLKRVPIGLARVLGKVTAKNRWIALVYVIVVFFLVPAIIIFITRI